MMLFLYQRSSIIEGARGLVFRERKPARELWFRGVSIVVEVRQLSLSVHDRAVLHDRDIDARTAFGVDQLGYSLP